MHKNTDKNKEDQNSKNATGKVCVGIDISKKELVADINGTIRIFPRTAEGLEQLNQALPAQTHVICEATGGYEKTLLESLHAARVSVSCVMPASVRHYALSQKIMAKNDRIDARLLSQYGRNSENLRPSAALSGHIEKLRELVRARSALLEQRTGQLCQAEHPSGLVLLKRQARARLKLLEKQIEQLDQAIREHINNDEPMRQRFERAIQIQGLGEVSVWNALCEMPELGSLKKGQAASLLGVAPMSNESGSSKSPREIHGGRSRPRGVLYMAAISASRHNPILKAVYERLIQRGKPAKLALVAVMRRLVELLNKLFADPNFILVR